MWRIVGASVIGRSHEATGRSCEDSSGWRADPAVTCLAVADGAGSKPRAASGSRSAVERVLDLVGADPTGAGTGHEHATRWLRAVFAQTRDRLEQRAAAEDHEPDEYATTLCVAVATPDLLCIGQIGDSIAVIASGGGYETVQPAPRHEYANETSFLTSAGALEQMRVMCFDSGSVDAVVLSTDGLRFQILDDLTTAKPYGPFFDDLISYAADPGANDDGIRGFLAGLADQSGDDKTLVVAVQVNRTEPDI
jgi:hypothetical protein